ncbi:MAG: hypothetical protein A6F70_10495 [Cycloclasticus sp. symbiont of Bathymodiolus heckerae]|nr:MAG: hypothetical protein A6F70_10495 [Cycloclasticus sp. symbiont of Bathymodiolus heckerae]
MFEFVVVLIIVGAAWYYFRQKKQAEGSESDTTAQTSVVKSDVTSAPEPVKAKPAGSRYFCESLFWASQPKQAAKT